MNGVCLYGCEAPARLYSSGWKCEEHRPLPVPPLTDAQRGIPPLVGWKPPRYKTDAERRREAIAAGQRAAKPRKAKPAGGVVVIDREDREDRQRAVDAPRADVGMDHPRQSHAAAAVALRRSGSLRAEVLALVAVRKDKGATSDEIERHLKRSHQSISATLYGLAKDGLCVQEGPTRLTQYRNEAVAYLVTRFGVSELRRVDQPRPADW